METATKIFFTRKEAAKWLGMTTKMFCSLVEAGKLPQGIRRSAKISVWTREDLTGMAWYEVHRDRFRAEKMPTPLTLDEEDDDDE